MLESQTIIAVAVISALTAGAVNIIKTLFSRNQNKKDDQDFILKLVASNDKSNDLLQQISYKLGENGNELKNINGKIDGLSVRVDRLENEVFDHENEQKRIG